MEEEVGMSSIFSSAAGGAEGACPSEESVMSRKCWPTALRLRESGVVVNGDLCGPSEREDVGSSVLVDVFKGGLVWVVAESGVEPSRIPAIGARWGC